MAENQKPPKEKTEIADAVTPDILDCPRSFA